MKKNILIVNLIFLASLGFISFTVLDNSSPHDTMKSSGGPPYNTNAPGEKTCSGTEGTNSCHSGGIPDNSGPATCTITSTGGTLYVPGQTYTITCSVTHPTRTEFGFQASVRRLSTNVVAGNIVITDANKTYLHPVTYGSCQTCQFICHKGTGISFPGKTGSWSFQWTAPATNVGNVRIYACFNATNNNNNETGDEIYFTNLTLTPSAVGVNELEYLYAVNVSPNPSMGEFSVATETGDKKEFSIYNVQGKLVESKISTDEVNWFDLRNQPKGLYFVKISIGDKTTVKKIITQ